MAAEGPLQAGPGRVQSAQLMPMRKLPELRGKPPRRVRGEHEHGAHPKVGIVSVPNGWTARLTLRRVGPLTLGSFSNVLLVPPLPANVFLLS